MNEHRALTESEWQTVRDNLPRRYQHIMTDIVRIPETCWYCHYFKDGYCRLHESQVPTEERGKKQPCYRQDVEPF